MFIFNDDITIHWKVYLFHIKWPCIIQSNENDIITINWSIQIFWVIIVGRTAHIHVLAIAGYDHQITQNNQDCLVLKHLPHKQLNRVRLTTHTVKNRLWLIGHDQIACKLLVCLVGEYLIDTDRGTNTTKLRWTRNTLLLMLTIIGPFPNNAEKWCQNTHVFAHVGTFRGDTLWRDKVRVHVPISWYITVISL